MSALIDGSPRPLTHALSTWRATDPPGVLPHLARVLDAQTGATEYEAELDVHMLAVDATSYRSLRERSGGHPEAIATAIAEIVGERGKLQNPWTGSGGVLVGSVRAVGSSYAGSELHVGELVMPLASLIAVPLRLDAVGSVNPENPHVPVSGRAIVTGRMACVRVPDDLPQDVALAAFDVYPAASYVREMAGSGTHVLIFGGGHAGLLATAAARESVGDTGLVTVVDRSSTALGRAVAIDPDATAIEADVTDAVGVATALAERGLPPADLTLLCTTATGAEGAAIVATGARGTIIFFSTATTFAAAALGADAVGSRASLVIPNGLTEDRGEYAFELLRRAPRLREFFEADP